MSLEVRVVSSPEDFDHCKAIRLDVFVHEQGCPEAEEFDALDAIAIHLLALEDGEPVGAARLVPWGEGVARIGRMAVRAPFRRRGVGTALMSRLLDLACANEAEVVHLAAQMHAIPFYERFGFTAHGDVFEEAGIPHRMMTLRLYESG